MMWTKHHGAPFKRAGLALLLLIAVAVLSHWELAQKVFESRWDFLLLHTVYRKQVRGNLEASFDLSPDGRSLVFAGSGDGGKDLYVLDLASLEVKRLLRTSDYEAYPAFSPDGQTIVYQATPGLDKPRYLFLCSLDGRHVRQLTRGTFTEDIHPCFSHDGTNIIFGRAHTYHAYARGEDTWGNIDVYIVGANGAGLKRLTRMNSEGEVRPKISPDDKTFLFEETSPLYEMNILKLDSKGLGPVQQVVQSAYCPCYFPDGKQILFVSERDHQLYRTASDASMRPIRTSRDLTQIHNPVLSPNGKTVYFLEGYNADLWRVDVDGRKLTKIADGTLFSDPLH